MEEYNNNNNTNNGYVNPQNPPQPPNMGYTQISGSQYSNTTNTNNVQPVDQYQFGQFAQPYFQGAQQTPPPIKKTKSNTGKIIVIAIISFFLIVGVTFGVIAYLQANVSPSSSLRAAFEESDVENDFPVNNYHIINTYKALCNNDCDIDASNPLYYYNQLNDDEKLIYESIDYAVQNYDAMVVPVSDDYIDENGYITEEYENMLSKVETLYYCDHPEFYWAYSGENYYLFNEYYYCDFHYTFSENEIGYTDEELNAFLKEKDEFNSSINSIVVELKDQTNGMDDWDKAFTIFNWVCDNTTYDMDISEKVIDNEYLDNANYEEFDEIYIDGGIYSAVVNGSTVCRGYAMLYNALAKGVGLECTYVSGNSKFYQTAEENQDASVDDDSGHAWNIVKIDNGYVNVDVTNGDLEDENDPKEYYFFAMDDASIKDTYIRDEIINLPECASPEYNYCQHEGLYSNSVNADDLDNAVRYSLENGYNTAIVQYENTDMVNEASQKYFDDSEILADILLKYNKNYDSQIDIDETGYYYINVDEDFNILTIYLTHN